MNGERVPVNPATAERIGRPTPLESLSDPIVCKALRIWDERRGGRLFPARADLVPKPIAPFLCNVMLIAILPGDFEFRIVGDAAVVAYGQNFQGLHQGELNALEAGFGDVIRRVCDSICRRRAPLGVKGIVARGPSFIDRHEGVFLPLGERPERVDHILFVAGYCPLDVADFPAMEGC